MDINPEKWQAPVMKIKDSRYCSEFSQIVNFLRDDKSTEILPEKKPVNIKKKLFSKTSKKNGTDNGSSASSENFMDINPSKCRGPVVQIKGSRTNSESVQVVNLPREDKEKNKEKQKTMSNGNANRNNKLNNFDNRNKVFRGEFKNSTIPKQYDSSAADQMSTCVFCKKGPHSIIHDIFTRLPVGVLSDLFGPYLVQKNFSGNNSLSFDNQEKDKKQTNRHSLRSSDNSDQFSEKHLNSKKHKFTNNVNNIDKVPDNSEQEQGEVWLHEQCIVWATGVFITGGRITGLQEAVCNSSNSICETCGQSGANIGCIKQGCKSVTHYCCALSTGWTLDADQHTPKCKIHKKI